MFTKSSFTHRNYEQKEHEGRVAQQRPSNMRKQGHVTGAYLSVEEYLRICPRMNSTVNICGFSESHTSAKTFGKETQTKEDQAGLGQWIAPTLGWRLCSGKHRALRVLMNHDIKLTCYKKRTDHQRDTVLLLTQDTQRSCACLPSRTNSSLQTVSFTKITEHSFPCHST